jgi:radical SAM protein with 4Fe4S-binding SPASM domain
VKRGRRLPVVGAAVGSKAHDWTAYNPFDNATCSGCQFASICKGGCPKRVLEQDTVSATTVSAESGGVAAG